MWAEPRLTSLCLIVSEVSRRGFTNQDLLRAMWSSQIPQLSAGTLSPCLYVHFPLLLAALPSTMALMSDTAPTVGIPGFPLELLHHPDHFSASLPYVQVLAKLISPAQLCYNIQQPFTPMNTLQVRHHE